MDSKEFLNRVKSEGRVKRLALYEPREGVEILSKVAGAAKRAAELGFGEYIRQVRC